MAKKEAKEAPSSSWAAQDPCPECGGRPGVNPTTGVELRTGHLFSCSQWKEPTR